VGPRGETLVGQGFASFPDCANFDPALVSSDCANKGKLFQDAGYIYLAFLVSATCVEPFERGNVILIPSHKDSERVKGYGSKAGF
jgi:hypothetical protein